MPRRRTSRLQGCHKSAHHDCKGAIAPRAKSGRMPWVRTLSLRGPLGSACGKRRASSCEAADGCPRFHPNLRARSVCGRIRGWPEGKRMRDRPADAFEVGLKESACEVGLREYATSACLPPPLVQPANARSGWPATSARIWKTAPAPGSSAVWRDVVMKTSRRSSPPRVTAVTPRTGSSHSPSTSASGE